MNLSWKCDGMGISGVTSAGFSFDVPLFDFPDYSRMIQGGALVVLTAVGYVGEDYEYDAYSKYFYVVSKSSADKTVTVKCSDKTIYTECDFPCTEDDFKDGDGNETEMHVNVCFGRIAEVCGFSACVHGVDIIMDFSLPKSMLMDKSCHDVLNEIAAVMCGYWVCENSGDEPLLYFIALGGRNNVSSQTVSMYYEKIKPTTSITVLSVYMTDGSTVYGGSAGGTEVIKIDSPLSSAELWSALYSRTSYYTYNGWKCDNALLAGIPDFPPHIYFDGREDPLTANYCDMKISSAGVIASVGCNTIDEGAWTYKPRIRRELEQRYKDGETWDNVKLTKSDGIKYVFTDKNNYSRSAGNIRREEYGFDVKGGGFTGYEGVMSSEKAVTSISVDKDAGTVTCTFEDGHVYEYRAEVTETANGYDISNEGDEWR